MRTYESVAPEWTRGEMEAGEPYTSLAFDTVEGLDDVEDRLREIDPRGAAENHGAAPFGEIGVDLTVRGWDSPFDVALEVDEKVKMDVVDDLDPDPDLAGRLRVVTLGIEEDVAAQNAVADHYNVHASAVAAALAEDASGLESAEEGLGDLEHLEWLEENVGTDQVRRDAEVAWMEAAADAIEGAMDRRRHELVEIVEDAVADRLGVPTKSGAPATP